jgi:predicted transcriptional regulator
MRFSVRRAAKEIGVHPVSLAKYESGTVEVPLTVALACEALERRAVAASLAALNKQAAPVPA